MSNPERAAVSAVRKIIDDLNDRSGFDAWWEDIDTGTKQEIRQRLASIIQDATRRPEEGRGAVLADVAAERVRQDAKWGEQNHPDGTGISWVLDGGPNAEDACETYRRITNEAADRGKLTWLDIALEEVAEAFAETDPAKLREELIQTAAVFVAWAEAIDRRTT